MTINALTLIPWQSSDGALSGWERSGSGKLVHFLHGNGFCGRTLWPMAQQLPSDWRLIFTDVPGHGGSIQPAKGMPDWQAMAASIGRQIDVMADGQPVAGVGHSMGGVLTLLMAAQQPQRFSSLDMLDPVLFSPEVVWAQRLMRKTGWWRRSRLVRSVAARRSHWPSHEAMQSSLRDKSLYRNWQAQALREFVQFGSKPCSEGVGLACDPSWEASIFGSYPRGLWSAVRRLQVPTHIWVADDSYFFIRKSAMRAAKNAHVEWHSFGQGHCFPMEQPQSTGQYLQQRLMAV